MKTCKKYGGSHGGGRNYGRLARDAMDKLVSAVEAGKSETLKAYKDTCCEQQTSMRWSKHHFS